MLMMFGRNGVCGLIGDRNPERRACLPGAHRRRARRGRRARCHRARQRLTLRGVRGAVGIQPARDSGGSLRRARTGPPVSREEGRAKHSAQRESECSDRGLHRCGAPGRVRRLADRSSEGHGMPCVVAVHITGAEVGPLGHGTLAPRDVSSRFAPFIHSALLVHLVHQEPRSGYQPLVGCGAPDSVVGGHSVAGTPAARGACHPRRS